MIVGIKGRMMRAGSLSEKKIVLPKEESEQ